MIFKHVSCVSVFALVTALAGAAEAQDAIGGPQPPAAPSVAPAAISNDADIIVTAQRRSEALERTPVAIAAVSGESLQKQAIISESDLQTAVPGLTVKAGQTSNQLNYSLRGQTVDAFSSSRPSVLPYFNEVQVGGSGSTAFYDLQSIQILKGPQGTLFGRNSTGGAVLFTSARPTNEFEGYAAARVGNYDHYQAEGALNLPIVDDRVLLRVAGFWQRRDGFQYNIFNDSRLGNVRRWNARGSLTLKPSESFNNTLVVDYARARGNSISGVAYSGRPASAGPAFVPTNLFYSPAVDSVLGPGTWDAYLARHPGVNPAGFDAEIAAQQQRGPFRVNLNAPNFHRSNILIVSNVSTLDIAEDTQIKNIIGYVHRRQQDAGEFDGTVFTADDNGEVGRGGTLRQFSEELQLIGKAFDRKLDYVIGVYYSNERDNTRSLSRIFEFEPFIPASIQINNGVTTNKTIAGYGQGTLDLSEMTGVEGLGVTAGVRYSFEKVKFARKSDDFFITNPNPAFVNPQKDTFKKASWQLGVQEQLNSNLLLYAVTRRSNRSGGFNYFAPPVPGFGNEAGGEYRPEIATDIEGGIKYRGNIGVPIRVNLAVYNMWVKNIQRSNYVQIFGSLAGITVNVPKAEITGFELDGSINPTPWLTVGGNLNYTDARFTDNIVSVLGNPAVAFETYPDTPKWSGVAYADANIPLNDRLRLNLRGDVYSQSSTFFSSTGTTLNPGTQLPKYTVANFRIGVDDVEAGWSLAAIMKNAFKETYFVGGVGFSSLFAVNTAVPGDPRTFLVEARFRF
ncbi:TonB-dependent receptor plug domain-containing protein [Sphingomonas sp. 1P06PA]|uniref:TonB-dependent receptor n=1 Tax=Sphingomonas sp. 1P06PA TaxID=554121 RepID=UPI0039A4D4CF